jgi:hypothetical protein
LTLGCLLLGSLILIPKFKLSGCFSWSIFGWYEIVLLPEKVKATPLPCCLQNLCELAGILNFKILWIFLMRISLNFRELKGEFKIPIIMFPGWLVTFAWNIFVLSLAACFYLSWLEILFYKFRKYIIKLYNYFIFFIKLKINN